MEDDEQQINNSGDIGGNSGAEISDISNTSNTNIE